MTGRIKLTPKKICTTPIATGRFLGKVQTYRGGLKSGTHSVEQETPPRASETAWRTISLVSKIRSRDVRGDSLVKIAHRILLSGDASLGRNFSLQKYPLLPLNNLSLLAAKTTTIANLKKDNKGPILQRSKDQILSAQITFEKEPLKHNSMNPINTESQPIITKRYLRYHPAPKTRFKLTPSRRVTQVTMTSKTVLKYA